MRHAFRCLGWAAAAVAIVLSPALVALGVPLGYGVACDVVASPWLAPLALALAAGIAINARRRREALRAAEAEA